MTIWERIRLALDPLGAPVTANVRMSPTPGDLPDLYIVYQLISGTAEQLADDGERSRTYRVQVTVYKRGGLEGLPNVVGAMTLAGFGRGPERELPYSDTTRHYGLAMDFFYLEEHNA